MPVATNLVPPNPANRLGLLYRLEATRLPWVPSPQTGIIDAHVHVHAPADGAAKTFFEAAEAFGVSQVWSQTPLEEVDELRAVYGDRIVFIAVPDYTKARASGGSGGEAEFADDWARRIEAFAKKGAKMAKFWTAPRGRDISPLFRLDHPVRLRIMRLARSLGMAIMTHVADPDTWFATHYKDARRYGTKPEHYEPLERLLDEFYDTPWLGAHMGGDPEHLDHLQDLLDRHPNYYIDSSATKWMVRELSKHPAEFRGFCERNPGRVLFGSDIVVAQGSRMDAAEAFDLYASRYWALRTLFETDYHGPSPIVDPDLPLLDPTLPLTAAPELNGAAFPPEVLDMVYHRAAEGFAARIAAYESRPKE
jgi:predicted TIM-barrel fold metal-dependent hydrolase